MILLIIIRNFIDPIVSRIPCCMGYRLIRGLLFLPYLQSLYIRIWSSKEHRVSFNAVLLIGNNHSF